MTSTIPSELDGSHVRSLIQVDQNKWDENILLDICNERNQNKRKIRLSRRDMKGSWFRLLEDKDRFTVKSCYRLLQGKLNILDAKLWKKLWSLKLHGKIINFLMCVRKFCLPTATRLSNKRIQIVLCVNGVVYIMKQIPIYCLIVFLLMQFGKMWVQNRYPFCLIVFLDDCL